MRKVTFSIITFILLYPAVASAAWWNPLSWSIFHKHAEPVVMQEPITLPAPFPTPIIEPTVEDDATINTTNEKPIGVVAKQSVVPVVKSVDNSAILKAQQDKLNAQAILDQKNAEQLAAQQKADQEAQNQAFINGIQKEAEEEAKNAPINSPECESAQNNLNNLNKKSSDIGKKYDKKIEDTQKNKEGKVAGALQEEISNLQIQKDSEMADFAVSSVIPAQSMVNVDCGLNISTPAYNIPTALCKDFTTSYSETRSGTCSYHGGVLSWY